MAKKKTKKVVEEIKSFNMPTGVINEDIQWQQPEGFSLQNKMQTIMVDQWPLHVLRPKVEAKTGLCDATPHSGKGSLRIRTIGRSSESQGVAKTPKHPVDSSGKSTWQGKLFPCRTCPD